MSSIDTYYHALSLHILEHGYMYKDKSREENCLQISSASLIHDFEDGFPVLTTKKIYLKGVVTELLWFLKGLDNLEYLHQHNNHIWDKDARNFDPENGMNVGRNYGVQWRRWTTLSEGMLYVDQIRGLINNLRNNPMGRRHIVTAWNPAELHMTALPPCHWAFEILPRPLKITERLGYTSTMISGVTDDETVNQLLDKEGVPKYTISLKWHQRSVDTFLGLPFNITSYAILCKIIGELTGYATEGIIGDLSNVHFYEGHIEKVKEQMKNDPNKYQAPKFSFSKTAKGYFELFREGKWNIDQVFDKLLPSDFIFEDYESYPPIKADMYEPIN